MRTIRLVSLLLACIMLFSLFCIPAAAEDTISFMPELKNGKLYGPALKTPQSIIRRLYASRRVEIYDVDGNLVGAESEEYIGTGYTLKLDGRLYYTVVVMGDVNGDGELTARDYILTKRACMGTYTLTNAGKQAAGMPNGGKLRPINYIKIKRAFFKTYNLNADYECDPYNPFIDDGWSDSWV